MTLMEGLVATFVLSILMIGVLQVMVGVYNDQIFSIGMPTVQENSRQMAITLANALRGATLCASTDTGCTLNAAVTNATASTITIYTRPSSAIVQTTYGLTGGSFFSKVGSASAVDLYPGATFTLTYYTSSGYHNTSLKTYSPTNTTTINLIAVGITTSVVDNGITGSYTTLVRLRNSPLKTSAGS
jgi:hypothetical protein